MLFACVTDCVYLCDLVRWIFQSRSNILNASSSYETIHAAIFGSDVRYDIVQICSILYVDSSVVNASLELSSKTALGFVVLFARLRKPIEAVY